MKKENTKKYNEFIESIKDNVTEELLIRTAYKIASKYFTRKELQDDLVSETMCEIFTKFNNIAEPFLILKRIMFCCYTKMMRKEKQFLPYNEEILSTKINHLKVLEGELNSFQKEVVMRLMKGDTVKELMKDYNLTRSHLSYKLKQKSDKKETIRYFINEYEEYFY